MTGDYTKVALRQDERWTGARLQQGRVLVEHEWNLNLEASTRTLADTARDVVGGGGVPEGSTAFKVAAVTSPAKDLSISAGRIWIDGMVALAPASFLYSQQDRAFPTLPAGGRVLVFLEAFQEHVQPAEEATLVDPALHPIDSCARTRVGWRVRAVPTNKPTCETAMAAANLIGGSTGRLTVERTAPPPVIDPCSPPGDPRGTVPHGLFRVEVLDAGTAATARFVWSYDNGAGAVPVRAISGATVTLAVSAGTTFAKDDLVEVSWLARRADRLNHTALYQVLAVSPAAGGDVLTLSRPVTAPANAAGLAVRRWDGQAVGAVAAVPAARGGHDLGVTFTAAAGTYMVGDWWGAALRPEADPPIEKRVTAAPDGISRSFLPLALVNLSTNQVESDCRPTFRPLTAMKDRTTCTVTVFPGEDLQAAVNALPAAGGTVCLAAGEYPVHATVSIQRPRVALTGAGSATVIRAQDVETALWFLNCQDVSISGIQVVGGPGGQAKLGGALAVTGCASATVEGTVLSCLDAAATRTSALSLHNCARVSVHGNQCAVGAWQQGIVVTGGADVDLGGNTVRYVPAKQAGVDTLPRELFAVVLAATIRHVAPAQLRAPVLAFAQEFDKRASALTGQWGSLRRAALMFARYVTGPARPPDIPEGWWNGIRDILADYLAGGAGIVVGGQSGSNSVRILDNVVLDCAQGIHVGYSSSQARGVQVRGNSVRVRLPHDHRRDRHAIAVSNAHSSWVIDNFAELTLTGKPLTNLVTPVDGLSLYGNLGPFALVRQNSFLGFPTGVRCEQSPFGAPNPNNRVWLVAENMAAGGTPLITTLPVVATNNSPH